MDRQWWSQKRRGLEMATLITYDYLLSEWDCSFNFVWAVYLFFGDDMYLTLEEFQEGFSGEDFIMFSLLLWEEAVSERGLS